MMNLRLQSVVVALCLTGIQARNILPDAIRFLSLLPLLGALLFAFSTGVTFFGPIQRYKHFVAWAFLLLVALLLFSMWITFFTNIENFRLNRLVFMGLVFAFVWIVFYQASNEQRLLRYFVPFIWGPVVYVVISMLLYGLRIRFNADDLRVQEFEPAVMLRALGIHVNRVRFALSEGVNSFSPVAGLSMLISMTYIRYKYGLAISLFFFIFSLIAVLLADGRAAIAYTLVSLTFAYLCVKARSLYLLPLLISLLIVLLPGLVILSSGFLGAVFDFFGLSRGGGDLSTLNERSLLWAAVFQEISNPKIQHLFGFGDLGHSSPQSTLSTAMTLITGSSNLSATSVHNTYLQILLNIGWVGLFVFVLYIFSTANMISRFSHSLPRKCVFSYWAIFFYLLLYCNTEVSVLLGGQLFFFFWGFFLSIAALYRLHCEQRRGLN